MQQAGSDHAPIHSVVYAAGPDIPIRFAGKIAADEWRHAFEHDTHAFFNLAKAALPALQRQRGGSLCAITTAQATKHLPLSALSSAPKAAIESLIAVIAKENGRFAIRANTIRAGWLAGGKLDDGMDSQLEGEVLKEIAAVPLGGLGRPQDVADAVVYLASDRARYITSALYKLNQTLPRASTDHR